MFKILSNMQITINYFELVFLQIQLTLLKEGNVCRDVIRTQLKGFKSWF